ncbi:MAG: type II toxin-antitoxin system prevent-host-death family antitoxin [candidate division KSB1 bacterium]
MPTIRPVSDLQAKTEELLHICAHEEQPIFLTKSGYGKFVMMSQDYFERMQAMTRLYSKLDEAQKLADVGDKGISHKEMARRMRARPRKQAQ